jgi:hypothetical protein
MRNRAEIPDLREYLNRRKDEILAQMNCISIGTVEKFYPETQKADISINFKRKVNTEPQVILDYPMLINCPVVVMNGGGAYVSYPIGPGDTCLVLFCDRDMDNWFETGEPMTPNTTRVHDLSDGIAIVGIRSKRDPIEYDGERLKMFFGQGYITIDDAGQIIINSPSKVLIGAPVVSAAGILSADFSATTDVLVRGEEFTIELPTDSAVPYSTEDIRRVWVVTEKVGDVVTIEERRLTLSRPPTPLTRVVMVK